MVYINIIYTSSRCRDHNKVFKYYSICLTYGDLQSKCFLTEGNGMYIYISFKETKFVLFGDSWTQLENRTVLAECMVNFPCIIKEYLSNNWYTDKAINRSEGEYVVLYQSVYH